MSFKTGEMKMLIKYISTEDKVVKMQVRARKMKVKTINGRMIRNVKKWESKYENAENIMS